MSQIHQTSPFLRLPPEIRLAIMEHVFEPPPRNTGFITPHSISACPRSNLSHLILDTTYFPSTSLALLLTCHQFSHDFTRLAFTHTPFTLTNPFTPLAPQITKTLHPHQIASIRHLRLVAGAHQFRDMCTWRQHAFNLPTLHLATLDIVFHSSGYWHYPADFTADVVQLLRRLEGVDALRFVRNGALVKGGFKTWCNRVVALVLKEDHWNRYDAPGAPVLEATWWTWTFWDREQVFELVAMEGERGAMPEEVYMKEVGPLVEALMRSVESEEREPDPRPRGMWA
ncbi:hypothetical protein BU24DRAFT_491558 [Aaosphaeria arxii CBS 175.79]|uniref:F-box domain-containing protein n=1 Tax=Aaosphaeria arxii CBS 175.79 TaxID=1450172 RepID=A0A6A5XSR7_9PLEO|nr:uncharacterized protein BU24DRAFT_491558 [Aaosphaeria arxii CBS 175.79]KAF2015294.1 hypothetical protein BU24DRAFT_491558 [Aaosphaeria arxii CBS 175.79]